MTDGARPWVLFVSRRGYKLSGPLTAAGYGERLTVIVCGGSYRSFAAGFGRLLWVLGRRRRRRPLLLTDTPINIGLLAWLAARLFALPYVYRARGDTLRECRLRGLRLHAWFFRRFFIPQAVAVIAVSGYLLAELRAGCRLPERQAVLPTPQPLTDHPPGLDGRQRRLLVVTSFALYDKIAPLFELLPQLDRLLASDPQLELRVLGDGRHLTAVKTAAARLRHADRLSFCGNRRPDDDYRGSLALLHVSELDAYPSVVNEARAWGLPVIASDSVGMREQIDHGRDGLLLRAAVADDLVCAYRQLLQPERWRQLAMNGYQRVKRDNDPCQIGRRLAAILTEAGERQGERR